MANAADYPSLNCVGVDSFNNPADFEMGDVVFLEGDIVSNFTCEEGYSYTECLNATGNEIGGIDVDIEHRAHCMESNYDIDAVALCCVDGHGDNMANWYDFNDDRYDIVGCTPSAEYAEGQGVEYDNLDPSDYSIPITRFHTGQYPANLVYQEIKHSLCTQGDCRDFNSPLINEVTCGADTGGCYYRQHNTITNNRIIKIFCVPDGEMIDQNGNYLDPSGNSPDYVRYICTNVKNDDIVIEVREDNLSGFRCTETAGFGDTTCREDHLEKIDGESFDDEDRYICIGTRGDTDYGYCCGYEGRVNSTDSNKGCVSTGDDYVSCMVCMYEIGDVRDQAVLEEGAAANSYEPTGAIWTSLGCIDPSPSGLITRLYQIG
ncbi:hypothetical protein JW978_01735, partial [Candidatus Dojkabacteria bacterium]|nr:hypothetical protein [Candidatus Dojkabacteria bacterium]